MSEERIHILKAAILPSYGLVEDEVTIHCCLLVNKTLYFLREYDLIAQICCDI